MIPSPQREEELFAAALALPPEQRREFLDRTLGGSIDSELRQRIDFLLLAHGQADRLEEAFHSVQAEAEAARIDVVAVDGLVGTRIDRFRIMERLGEGGCGIVYLAEQQEPVRRRVALKVIKAGMDTRAVIARFEAERQALALMDHPNIARVLDGGTTEMGRPYFVMELVRGVPITQYCDQAKSSTEERLELFVQVCDAVQHAHQKGIIHRDLKPSNLLVAQNDGVAFPKVIDFGIAKATSSFRLTEKTLYTRFNDFIGTPIYMSPEQAVMTNIDVDTRSDVYSLGVILYELLTAQLPFDRATLEQAGVDEARRMLREVDPPRPSSRVSALTVEERATVAQRRAIEPGRLAFLLCSDLDWIVLRCLEKDRGRRYETVNGLAKDIQRYLDNEPVLARPPSAAYRLRKLVRRNRLAFAAGAAVISAIALGFIISTLQVVRATRAEREQSRLREQAVHEREVANAARAHAESLLGYLLEDFFTELQPIGRVEIVGGFAHRLISYYDSLPPGLQNQDTDRNRALAQLREGGAMLRGKQVERGAAELQVAQDFFTQRYAARPNDESAALDLAVSLGWQFAFGHLAVNTQVTADRTVEQFRRASDLARPYATRVNASLRARRIYGLALSELGPTLGNTEEGLRTCEEAQSILSSLGAKEANDWALTVSYCCAADGEAQDYLSWGKLDQAEQIENENAVVLDRMRARQPGNLEVLATQWGIYMTQSEIAERRHHPVRAAKLAEDALQAARTYAGYDGGAAGARVGPWFAQLRVSDLYWKLGRIRESLNMSYSVLAEMDAMPVGRDWTLPERSYWSWQANMYRELELGHEDAAARCVVKFTQEAEKLRQLNCGWENYLTEFTKTARRLAEYSLPADYIKAFDDAREDLNRLKTLPRTGTSEGYWDGLHVRALSYASMSGALAGRFSEVEALVHSETTGTPSADFNLEMAQLEPHLWLALALARQNESTECAKELKPLLVFYRHARDQGDQSLDIVRGFAFCHYVQAINQSADPGGQLRRRAELKEAAQALDVLPDEAKQLRSIRDVIDRVAVEKTRLL